MYDQHHKLIYRIFLVIAVPFGLFGILYGAVLLFKREYRREGGIMIAWSLITISILFLVGTYLLNRAYIQAASPEEIQLEIEARKNIVPGKVMIITPAMVDESSALYQNEVRRQEALKKNAQ